MMNEFNEVGNEVYGTITLDVSIPVASDNEQMAMLEAGYMIDADAVAQCIVIIVDVFGRMHEVSIHNYKADLHMFLN